MSNVALEDFMVVSKYSRFDPDKERRETWQEAQHRCYNTYRKHLSPRVKDSDRFQFHLLIDMAEKYAKHKLAIGSQRALQFGGDPVVRHNARLYNCTVSYCDRPRFFGEALYLMLCGCGVGSSMQKHHVAKLPPFRIPRGPRVGQTLTFVIPDSIEGWADAVNLKILFELELPKQEAVEILSKIKDVHGRVLTWEDYDSNEKVEFDFSLIRPAGSAISSAMGKAPGPEPLRNALYKVERVFRERANQILEESNSALLDWTQYKLRPIDCLDIKTHLSDAILAGGVRRAATSVMFSADDEDMLKAKTGDWFKDNPQRARANISAVLIRDNTTFEQFKRIIRFTREFGEPGFVWTDSTEVVFNPCFEIGMYPVNVDNGKSGWQFCNLSTINITKVVAETNIRERLDDAAMAAAIQGTLQAAFTDFPYLGSDSEEITRREALIGVSLTGIMDGLRYIPSEWFDRTVNTIKETNRLVAGILQINPAARTTAIKPSGNSSATLGTSDGIGGRHAAKYLRGVQSNKFETPAQFVAAVNPEMVEESVWSANNTDYVIRFPITAPHNAVLKADLTALTQLRHIKDFEQRWVEAGRNPELCAYPHTHNAVSNTVVVREHEWDSVIGFIFRNRQHLTCVSLLSDLGELDYPQAPYVTIYDHQELAEMYGPGVMFASGLVVDGLHAFGDLWHACTAAVNPLWEPAQIDPSALEKEIIKHAERNTLQRDWVRRAKKFAANYFEGNVQEMTYCLKRVHYYKRWCDIQRTFSPLDFTKMRETGYSFNPTAEAACGGSSSCDVLIV